MQAIRIDELTKRYGDTLAVDHLSLTVEQGEVLALLGVNGAGKSTTIRMLTGLTPPTSGEAWIYGNSITEDLNAVKRVIGISPQETAVAPNLTVHENLQLMAGIHGVPKDITPLMQALHLDEVAKKRAKTLSGGWQRRLSIAMALISKPKVLFLDEPTLGLDVLARRELWHLIEGLRSQSTIILTTHYLEEAEALADRIAVMTHGKLAAVGTAQALMDMTGTTSFEDAFVTLAAGEVLA